MILGEGDLALSALFTITVIHANYSSKVFVPRQSQLSGPSWASSNL